MNRLKQLAIAAGLLTQTSCADAKTRLQFDIDGHVARNGEWAAGCDNVGRCTAIGMPRPPASREPAKDAPYAMGIIFQIEAEPAALATLDFFPLNEFTIDGLELFRIEGLPSDMGRQFRFLFEPKTIPAESAFELVRMMRAGKTVRGVNDKSGDVRIRFPRSGFGALASAIDMHREKHTPPLNEFEDRPLNKLRPVAVSEGRGHSALQANEADLPCEPRGIGTATQKFVMLNGALLFRLECDQPNRITRSYSYEVGGKSDRPTLLVLPEPRDDALALVIDGLSESSFDPETGILQSLEIAVPEGDCGVWRRWATTRAGWKLVERREMPVCGSGLEPADWIRTYRSQSVDEELVL